MIAQMMSLRGEGLWVHLATPRVAAAVDGTCLNGLERVAHHGDEHVGEYNDDGHVVQREQEQSHALDHGRGVPAAREARRVLSLWSIVWSLWCLSRRVLAVGALGRVFDLDVVDRHQPEHRPEQTVQRPRQPDTSHQPYRTSPQIRTR